MQMYEDSAPQGPRKIKGRLLSAKGDSVMLKLKAGQVETSQRKRVRKGLAYPRTREMRENMLAEGEPERRGCVQSSLRPGDR